MFHYNLNNSAMEMSSRQITKHNSSENSEVLMKIYPRIYTFW